MSCVNWFGVWWHHHEYDQEKGIGMPYDRSWYLFYKYREQQNLYVQGFNSRLLLEERHSWKYSFLMSTFKRWKNKNENFFSNILKCDNSSDDMKEKIDHWLDSFEKFYKQYKTIPTESYKYSFPEESRYIAVRPPPGFINQENETRCYFNATIQLLYCNFLFRQLILNIYCYTMMNCLNINNQQFFYH